MDNKRAVQILRDSGVYMPAIVPSLGGFRVYSGLTLLGSGATIDSAMERAGMLPPPIPPAPIFYAEGVEVRRLEGLVATAKSKSLASRIANALNSYMPDRRGR